MGHVNRHMVPNIRNMTNLDHSTFSTFFQTSYQVMSNPDRTAFASLSRQHDE
ncbi:hypothetical protein Y027_4179 [Burkholderia pseudomallei TSV5]|nr:hypothetical protein X948_4779 [Burkholderia pseudomallei MSHR5608]KGX55057.1 hypothetical protein Y027_4179 [Burkholderia pseudomallei TSV5]